VVLDNVVTFVGALLKLKFAISKGRETTVFGFECACWAAVRHCLRNQGVANSSANNPESLSVLSRIYYGSNKYTTSIHMPLRNLLLKPNLTQDLLETVCFYDVFYAT